MRHRHSDYMLWAKTQGRARFNLATSGVGSFPLHELPVTIDQLEIPSNATLALKIDVEGEELNVLEGAAAALRCCKGFIVQFEAHPDVMARTGLDPSRCLALLQAHGATRYAAFCELTGERYEGLTPERPFFEQVRGGEIYDVIAIREDM